MRRPGDRAEEPGPPPTRVRWGDGPNAQSTEAEHLFERLTGYEPAQEPVD